MTCCTVNSLKGNEMSLQNLLSFHHHSPPASPPSSLSQLSGSPCWQGRRNAHSSTTIIAEHSGTKKAALRSAPFILAFFPSGSHSEPMPTPPVDRIASPSSLVASLPISLWLQYCLLSPSSVSCLIFPLCLSLHSSSSSSSSSSTPCSWMNLLPLLLRESDVPVPMLLLLPRPLRG